MPATFKDYYAILEVPRTASEDEIKKAYRRLARLHHPDLHPAGDKESHTARMQEINEAYAVLGGKENRVKYDQYGQNWKDGPPPPEPGPQRESPSSPDMPGGEAFSEFFKNLFGGGGAGSPESGLSGAELDIEAVLEISLEDAVKGVEKSFSLTTLGLCQRCRGTGRAHLALCPACGGLGEIKRPREVKANIPPGLVEGNRIRLKSQGNEGATSKGDLYLEIRLKPDPRFKINGMNLETETKIMPWQAALGSEIPVQTLDGSVRIRIPKGSHTGLRLRVAGKGLGKPASRGDLFIRLTIDLPPTLSPKAEALMKQLEEETHA